jgi:hypothetical protein
MIRISVAMDREVWRSLRRLAEEGKGKGRTSVAQVIREMVATALAKRGSADAHS